MTLVLAGGVFDIIHKGHEFFLKKAKAFGTELIVVVANDVNVTHKDIVHNQEERAENVRSLGIADIVIIGKPGDDYFQIVEMFKPDIIAIGYDQEFPDLKEKIEERGLNIKVIKISESLEPEKYKSSLLREM